MPIGLGIGMAAAPIVGGVVGNLMSAGDREAAMKQQQAILDQIKNIHTPEASELALSLQKYQSAGQLSPQMEQTFQQGATGLKDINVDPRLRNAQMQTLDTLDRISQGGIRPEDQAALQRVQNQVAQQERGSREAILQNMAQRGIGGSGAEFAAQLQNSQSGANRAQSADLDIAGQASTRALQALQAKGTMGQSLESQQYGEAAQAAAAQDAINRYNAMNAQSVAGTNTGATNAAQAGNLQNLQSIYNANTGIANQQAQYNAQLPMQIYGAQLQKAQAMAGPGQGLANSYNQQAGNTQSLYGGIGQGVGQGLGAGASYAAGQQAQANSNAQQSNYLDTLRDIYGKPKQVSSGMPGSSPADYK